MENPEEFQNGGDEDYDTDDTASDSSTETEEEEEFVDIEGGSKDDPFDNEDIDLVDEKIEKQENDEDEIDNDEIEESNKKLENHLSNIINPSAPILGSDDDDDDDEDEMDESYLQKFDASINKNYITDFHPECVINNYDEIIGLTKIIRDTDNNIIDDLHKTLPYLTKYEKARVLGQRAKQINSGAKVFVKVPDNIIDGYLVAELELAQKRIPFIIRRPTPGGGCEYWNLKDLELIQF